MWKQLRVLAVNATLVVVVGVVWMVLRSSAPHELGFYCSDTSISKPYHSSTVTSAVLYSVGYTVPFVVVLLTELYLQNGGGENVWRWRISLHMRTLPPVLAATLKTYLFYVFAAFSTILLTNAGKVTVGRLRPNFLDVCNPDWEGVTCLTPDGRPRYVTDYRCLGNTDLFGDDALSEVAESRKSFPSGHASFSFQAAAFCALYLQARIAPITNKTFVVPFLQLVAASLAFLTGLSRVTDFKHHPTDVLAGAILGAAVQICNVVYTMGLFWRGGSSGGSGTAISAADSATSPVATLSDPAIIASAGESQSLEERRDGSAV